MSCSGRKSKSNPYSKEDLIVLAIEKGMSKSKAQKSSKSDLCEYLEIGAVMKSFPFLKAGILL